MGWWLGLAPATLEFWVRFPNERNQGKQGAPCVKVPGSSRVPEQTSMHRDERKRAARPPPPGGWPAGSTSPSSPQGLETLSRKRTRTDLALSPSAESNCTLGAVVDTHKDIRRVTADSYQGHTPSTYRDWLQGRFVKFFMRKREDRGALAARGQL